MPNIDHDIDYVAFNLMKGNCMKKTKKIFIIVSAFVDNLCTDPCGIRSLVIYLVFSLWQRVKYFNVGSLLPTYQDQCWFLYIFFWFKTCMLFPKSMEENSYSSFLVFTYEIPSYLIFLPYVFLPCAYILLFVVWASYSWYMASCPFIKTVK